MTETCKPNAPAANQWHRSRGDSYITASLPFCCLLIESFQTWKQTILSRLEVGGLLKRRENASRCVTHGTLMNIQWDWIYLISLDNVTSRMSEARFNSCGDYLSITVNQRKNQLRRVPSTQDKSVTRLLSRVFIYVFSAYTSSTQRGLVVSGCTLWQAGLSWQQASCFIIAHRGNTSAEGADRLPSWKRRVWCVGDVLAEQNCSNCGPIVVLSNRGF